MYIDASVYPDVDQPPEALDSPEAKADYVQRICAAWDFGVHPDPRTFAIFSEWKEIFDRFPLATSPAWHAMRAWFGWESIPYPCGIPAPTPRWVHLDRLEGRPADPCESML